MNVSLIHGNKSKLIGTDHETWPFIQTLFFDLVANRLAVLVTTSWRKMETLVQQYLLKLQKMTLTMTWVERLLQALGSNVMYMKGSMWVRRKKKRRKRTTCYISQWRPFNQWERPLQILKSTVFFLGQDPLNCLLTGAWWTVSPGTCGTQPATVRRQHHLPPGGHSSESQTSC